MRWLGTALVLLVGCGFSAPIGSGGGDAAPGDAPRTDAPPPDGPPPSSCPAAYTLAHGTSRYRLGAAASWYDAQLACEADGAHLVVVDDAAENAFVHGLQPTGDLWLGLSDHQAENTFRWVTGAAVTGGYQNWQTSPPQPNNAAGVEDCAIKNTAGVWNDVPCDFVRAYVCECDGVAAPAPTWCRTGTLTSCDHCDDRCDQMFDGDGACSGSHVCFDGD